MSFKIGQLLSNNLTDAKYLNKSLNKTIRDLETTNEITGNKFIDKRITNIYNPKLTAGTQGLASDKHYYLKLIIKRKFPNHNQNITLRLSNDQGENKSTNYQYVDDFIIFAGGTDTNDLGYAVYETVISPNADYGQINVILGREMVDYYTTTNPENPTEQNWDSSSYRGREIEISSCEIYEIQNVLEQGRTLTKVGIQGPPGMLMCINGQPIRIGPSGIYEIKNGYKVTFLGFVRKVSNVTGQLESDRFIVDYQYEEGV